jgi:DNA-nicking Smr family endonuclease
MRKKPEITEDDQAIFREAMHGTKRFSHSKIQPIPKMPKKRKKSQNLDAKPLAPLSDFEKVDSVSSEERVEFHRSGISNKTLRKLHDGKYNVENILDLHGMRVDEAKEALYHFILHCQQHGNRSVLIIHGKGRALAKPVLKNCLNNWLRQLEQVLAFCSAAAKDGRSGAMYVFLKQQKGEAHFDE